MAVATASIGIVATGSPKRYPLATSSISFNTNALYKIIATSSISFDSTGQVRRYPLGSGFIEISAGIDTYTDSGSISMNMELNVTVTGQIPNVSEPVVINMELDTTIGSLSAIQNSGSIVMFGFFSMYTYQINVSCMGIKYNFEPQVIDADLCEEGDNEMIERYNGDTYPIEVVFSKNGNHDVSGYTFKLYTQVGSEIMYETDGTIIDSTNGFITFAPVIGALDVTGSGTYEMKALDSNITTFAHGTFEILDALA